MNIKKNIKTEMNPKICENKNHQLLSKTANNYSYRTFIKKYQIY